MSKSPEKLLREIVFKDVENMSCFECGKSPVSFVNMISYSFCCQTCSGLLYQFGRVKSISAATFSPNELELLQSIGGNKNARLIWMHKYAPAISGGLQIRDLIELKYKDKRWYNPAVIEDLKMNDRKQLQAPSGIDAPTMAKRRRNTEDEGRSPVKDLFNESSSPTPKISTIQRQQNSGVPPEMPRQKSVVTDLVELDFSSSSNTFTELYSKTAKPTSYTSAQDMVAITSFDTASTQNRSRNISSTPKQDIYNFSFPPIKESSNPFAPNDNALNHYLNDRQRNFNII